MAERRKEEMSNEIKDEVEQAFRQGYEHGRKAKNDSVLRSIAEHYGYERQREQFVEECSEAILAVQKCKRGKSGAFENFKEEVADVLIMAEQMRQFIGTEEIDRIIDAKLHRQIERMRRD